jgi:cytochrome P460
MRLITTALLILSLSPIAHAGGNPEHVSYPEGYKSEFTHYDTRNRVNGKQVAVLYANKIAMETTADAKLGDDAKIVMEVYKTKAGEDGKPITGADGLFEKGKFAAIAVMEKRSNWDSDFDAKQRAGDWGFALYKTDGTIKDNKLDCASCHTPMPESDYLFSHSSLVEFTR